MKLLYILLFILHCVVIGGMLPMLLNSFVYSSWGNLSALVFPILMIINIFIIIIWIILWKKRAFVFIVISLLFFNATTRWVNYNKNSTQGTVKVLTYNTKGGIKGNSKLQDFLGKKDYDVIFLQEYQRNIKLNNVADNGLTKIITPHKILRQENILADEDLANAFYADIEVKGRIVRCINVYLEPFRLEKAMVKPTKDIDENTSKVGRLVQRMLPVFKIHKRQVLKIRKIIEVSPYPVLVAGDLNAVPNSYEYFIFSEHLIDAFMETGKGSATSFHDYKIPIRIDYIFSSKELRPTSYEVLREIDLSDHFPVIAEFNL